jgi:hypothetical protein
VRIHLEATAEELAAKGSRLVGELAQALEADAPGLAKALGAAQEAVTQPRPSPHPALEELLGQSREIYAHRLQQMIAAIGKVLDRDPGVEKSLPEEAGWVELSESVGEQLWAMLDLGDSADGESLEKAGAVIQGQPKAGHKYLRRVPFTGKDGKRRYRYYYTAQAMGRQAQAGEAVRVGKKRFNVTEVDAQGRVTYDEEEDEGGDQEAPKGKQGAGAPGEPGAKGAQPAKAKKTRTVSAEEWVGTLAEHYGAVVEESMDRRARQAVRAVTKLVPAELLADLQGATDAERMEDLGKRVPDVYERLKKAFARAGVDPWRSKQVIARSLSRMGWEDEGKAAAIGSVLTPEGAQLAKRHLQLLDAAENLAGGRKVKARHVQAAAEIMQASPEKFAAAVKDTAERAEAELVRLHQLLQVAKQGGAQEAGQLLQAALSSPAVKQLLELAQAFPGLQDRAIPVAQQIMAQIPAVAPRKAASTHGSQTNVFVAGEGGRPKAVKAQYRLVEADEVQASHDPTEGFKPNEKYPRNVQERVYHRDKAEQLKVLRNAQQLNPAFVANTNPDAVNGPPLVGPDGVVLGGNSRTMSMQVAYSQHPGKAQEYKDYLAEHAQEFGLKDSDVHALKHPILVRVVEVQDSSEKGLQLLVRQFNESFTQAMDPRTMQIALGKKVDDRTIEDMAASMRDDESLGEFLSGPRAEAFVQALYRTGVIDDRNSSQFVRKGTRHLNEDGKTLVSRMLVGRLVGDADLMAEIRPKALDAVANATPFLLMATQSGKKYDLGPSLRTALDALNVLQNHVDAGTIKPVDSKIPENQLRSLTESFLSDMFGGRHPLLEDERARALLDVLVRKPGPQQLAKVFREYAHLARQNPEGQGSLLGNTLTPEQVFKQAIVGAGKKEAAEAEAAKAPKEKEPKIIKRRVGPEEAEPEPAPAGPTAEEQPGLWHSLDAQPEGLEDLAKAGGQPPAHAGGPFIGPRGGKWADPAMTIPWDPNQHAQTSIFEFKPPPGTRSAADKPAKMVDPLVRTLAQTEEKIRKLNVEHVHFLGKEGEAVVPPLSGDRDSCRIMGDVLNKVREHGDVVFTHNHPDNLCFSREDIFLAVNFNMAEIRAVTKAGVFVMHRPEGGWLEKGQVWKDALGPVQGAYSAGHDKASDVMVSRMEEASKNLPGNPPADENHPDYSEEKWNGILAAEQFKAFRRDLGGRFGWKFTFEPAPAGAPNAGGGGEARPGAGQAQAKAPPQEWEGKQQGLLSGGKKDSAAKVEEPEKSSTLPAQVAKMQEIAQRFGTNRKANLAIAVEAFKALGVPVRMLSQEDPAHIREGIKKKGAAFHLDGEIVINPYSKMWSDPKGRQKAFGDEGKRFYSSGDPARFFLHEYAHYLFDDGGVPDEYMANNHTLRAKVKAEVGEYAGSSTKEFISEVFAATALGKKYSDFIMSEYNHAKRERPGRRPELSKASGPYVGPKGGLWEDPEHTRHWDPKEHQGGQQGAQLGLFVARTPAPAGETQQAEPVPEPPVAAEVAAERPKPAEEPSPAANGGPSAAAPPPRGEREFWKVTEIHDHREVDFLTGKRAPMDPENKKTCERCGALHQITYTMESNKGRTAHVGSGCGPAMAGGAEYLDAKSVLEAKKQMEKEARDQHLQRALRWQEETTADLAKKHLTGVAFPAVEEGERKTPVGFESPQEGQRELRTADGLARMFLPAFGSDRAERLESLKRRWADVLSKQVVDQAEIPWPEKWPKKAPGINAKGAVQESLRVWIVENILPELKWKAPT